MTEFTQYLITGLAVGMVYSLIGLGFALIWKSSSVANLALGQLVLLCSWFTYSMMVDLNLPIWIAFPALMLFSIGLGWVIERFALRPLIAQPILSLIAVTLGIAYFISGLVSFVWPLSIAALPTIFPKEPIHIGNAVISQEYLWAAGISLVVFGLLTLFYKYHKMGIAMRAAAVLDVRLCRGGHRWNSDFQHRRYLSRTCRNRITIFFSCNPWRIGLLHRRYDCRPHNRTCPQSGRRLFDSLFMVRNQ
jgi:branched-subunit amino acid ABC-type transport system permease component